MALSIVMFQNKHFFKDTHDKLTSAGVKMACGHSTLFLLAASFSMASASPTLPRESSQRGDSGTNLGRQTQGDITVIEMTVKTCKTLFFCNCPVR